MVWKIALLLVLLPGMVGMTLLVSYSNRPGTGGESVSAVLPGDLQTSAAGNTTVLLFYHPHCPCTRATVRCLERLAVAFSSEPRIIAYAFIPSSEDDTWVESSTTEKLRSLGDVTIIADRNAKACQRFKVATSGHVLAYSGDGNLRFSGGITPSRGHEGGCTAGAAFLNTVNGNPGEGDSSTEVEWPVFGCPISTAKGGA